jgi:hypothetical protein
VCVCVCVCVIYVLRHLVPSVLCDGRDYFAARCVLSLVLDRWRNANAPMLSHGKQPMLRDAAMCGCPCARPVMCAAT